nr:hypothetical protein [uncultured Lachnoclostridium sp.]
MVSDCDKKRLTDEEEKEIYQKILKILSEKGCTYSDAKNIFRDVLFLIEVYNKVSL